MKESLAQVLLREGYISEVSEGAAKKNLRLKLKYSGRKERD